MHDCEYDLRHVELLLRFIACPKDLVLVDFGLSCPASEVERRTIVGAPGWLRNMHSEMGKKNLHVVKCPKMS